MKKILSLLLIFVFAFQTILIGNNAKAATSTKPATNREILFLAHAVYGSTNTSKTSSDFNYVQSDSAKAGVKIENNEIAAMNSRWQKIFAFKDNTFSGVNKVGFSMAVYYNKFSKEAVVSYAGSDDWEDWVREDLGVFLGGAPSAGFIKKFSTVSNYQYLEASTQLYGFLTKLKSGQFKGVDLKGVKIIITGHSLGGFLAQKASLMYFDKLTDTAAKYIKKQDLSRVVTFNAPGFFDPSKLNNQDQIKYITIEQWKNNLAKNNPYKGYYKNYLLGRDKVKDEVGSLGTKIGSANIPLQSSRKIQYVIDTKLIKQLPVPMQYHSIKLFYEVIK